jgi:hypothetical protein
VGRIRPGLAQRLVLHLEPKRAAATLGYAFLTLLAITVVVAAFLYGGSLWPKAWLLDRDITDETKHIVEGVAGFLALLFLLGAIVNGRRWHIGRVVERWSKDPRVAALLPDTTVSPPAHRAATIPPLEVRPVKARKLPKPGVRLRRVTPETNVIGRRPLGIAYLRLFENQPRVRTFIESAWREFGYVYLLRSATSVTPSEYRWAKRSGNPGALFIASRERLLPALDGGTVLPKGRYRLRFVGPTTIRVRDRYGSYGVHALLCHGSFWRQAVDVLLERVDLVAVDLSGFREENAGTRYEMQRVVDRFPIERVVFLADQRSKQKFLAEQIQLAWSQMAAGSPNATAGTRVAVVVVTDSFQQRTTTQGGQMGGGPGGMQGQAQTTQVQVRLVARRRDTRRAAAMAQARVDDWMATHRVREFST